ncbi:lipocalin family protein [Pedobacter sp. SYSU D00535]|uniref:lipocalin family protein n=1 Tax=Pedobacter sp. SYSU D00535 TaxID=2810308 RepID=UPI001A97AF46|nr:lipocalin family protein [Pedobacter sp. SYSU D00535]
MKKSNSLLVILLTLTVALASCKKDEDDNATKILGKWKLKKEVEKEYLNNQLLGTDEYTYPSGAYVEFKSNGTLEWNEDGSDPETYRYSVDGDKLVVTEAADRQETFTIQELTSSKLTFSEVDEITIAPGQVEKEENQYLLEK